MAKSETYTQAGVDIDKAKRLVDRIRPLVRQTHTPGVMTDIGGFGGLFSLSNTRYRKPVLVASTDGVGTKLKVAFQTGRHDTVGIDLVAMCVNDIIVQGARPLFFLDYLATGHLDEEVFLQIISGVVEGCNQAKAALIGGETAELPDLYRPGEYDLAGFVVGVVDDENIVDGASIKVGDRLIGVASSGLHSNGYSLVRKVFFKDMGLGPNDRLEGLDLTLGEELLKPTRIYAETVANLTRDLPVAGMAHITGGGLTENVPRMLPERCRVVIEEGSWPVPEIFNILQQAGKVSQEEMYRVFNNGIGLVLVIDEERVDETLDRLAAMNEPAWIIGRVEAAEEGRPSLEFV